MPTEDKFDVKQERAALKKIIESPTPLSGEDGFPRGFDYRGALMRAFEFFADETPEGEKKREQLRSRIVRHPFASNTTPKK